MYIETALVSSAGKLLIQLSDGTVIDAGRVQGPAGPAGKDGADGSPGIPGAKGDPGTNGSRWYTGVGAPELGLGENSDLYLDVASALLPIYQKVNNDWLFLANLKATPVGSGSGGQGGAAGGGGSIIIYPKPDGGLPPSTDNDGKPIDKGDIWLDTNTGWLWVYDGNVWLPVGDRPPVSVGPNPPVWNPGGDTNNRYPIFEGSLWFDSDQLALYVAANDSNNNLVWVITIPADRSVLLDQVPANPFVFPGSSTGGYANDGDTVFNPTTQLWYIYNGSKNQWIDLPPGRNELSLTAILLREDNLTIDFEYNAADRVTYDTDALCYVNAADHENFTRIVVPFTDTAGFDWQVLLRGITVGDQLSLIQFDRTDPDNVFPFRSDYITVAAIEENNESFNLGIDFQQESPNHLPEFGEEVAIRFKAIVNVGNREVYYQEFAPDPIANPDLADGNLWVDSDDNKLYVWNGSVWSEVTACGSTEDDDGFVKKEGGDSMEGPLSIMGGRSPNAEGIESSLNVYNVDSGRDGDLQLRRNGQTKVYVSTIGITLQGDVKMNIDGSKLKSSTDAELLTFNKAGIFYEGAYTAEKHIATKKDVDDADAILSNQIIELEEEIESLAPSVERGQWFYDTLASNTARDPQSGHFYLLKNLGASPDFTENYAEANGVVLHNIDKNAVSHGWADVKVGKLIQLFDSPDPDYVLGRIVEVVDNYYPDSVRIKFDVISSKGSPTNDSPYVTRLNIFEEPSGGTADDFIRSGGTTEMQSNVRVVAPAGTNYNFAVYGNTGTTAFFVQDANSTTTFRVKNNGQIQAGNNAASAFIATENHDLTTKKYVDDKIINSPGAGRRFKFGDSTKDGEFNVNNVFWYFNVTDLDGCKLVHDTATNFSWTTPLKMTIWDDTSGSLMAAAELGRTTDHYSAQLRFKKSAGDGYREHLYRNLNGGTTYRVVIEGYF